MNWLRLRLAARPSNTASPLWGTREPLQAGPYDGAGPSCAGPWASGGQGEV